MQEIWAWSLGQEDPLEEGTAICFSILTWEIPWTEEPGGLQLWGHKKSDMTEQLTLTSAYFVNLNISSSIILLSPRGRLHVLLMFENLNWYMVNTE